MTASPSYVKARAEVRCARALVEYRYFRRLWSFGYSRGRVTPLLAKTLVCRAEWTTLHSLLTEPPPDPVALRANGLDADELALMAGRVA